MFILLFVLLGAHHMQNNIYEWCLALSLFLSFPVMHSSAANVADLMQICRNVYYIIALLLHNGYQHKRIIINRNSLTLSRNYLPLGNYEFVYVYISRVLSLICFMQRLIWLLWCIIY